MLGGFLSTRVILQFEWYQDFEFCQVDSWLYKVHAIGVINAKQATMSLIRIEVFHHRNLLRRLSYLLPSDPPRGDSECCGADRRCCCCGLACCGLTTSRCSCLPWGCGLSA